MSHTKEPWVANGNGIHSGVHCVALTQAWEAPIRQEDARRIVACVNACKGISTEELERLCQLTPMLFSEWLNTPDPVHDKVVQQRDELLAAAKNLHSVKGRFHTEQAYKALMQVVDSIKG